MNDDKRKKSLEELEKIAEKDKLRESDSEREARMLKMFNKSKKKKSKK